MLGDTTVDGGTAADGRFGWRAAAATLALHTLALAAATWPVALHFPFWMPVHEDSMGSLWLLHWYKACLFEGRSVWFCPEVMHPAGVPMGFFTPLYVQALIFSAISLVIPDPAVCWNLIVLAGVLGTGMGTSWLAWHLVRDRACAAFAGLMMVLFTPMLLALNVHLEVTYVGGFPVFLVAWMRFVDRPGARRLLGASLTYLLIAASCGYYMVFAVFPAALYVIWAAVGGGWRSAWPWLRARLSWLAGMAALTLAGLLVIYSGQVWMFVHGYRPTDRPRILFEVFAEPLWAYVVPPPWHPLGALLSKNPYKSLGELMLPKAYYLGVVTIGLAAYSATRRGALRRSSFVWSAFALMVVLSLGASLEVGGRKVSLPAGWLWSVFPPIRMTRVICRFGVFAGVFAGVLAAAGLKPLLARLPGRGWRAAAFAGLAVVAVADRSLTGIAFDRRPLPEAPGCYEFLLRHDPKGALLEVPEGHHGLAHNVLYTYWQSRHRMTTSAGITGVPNTDQDGRSYFNSPFHPALIEDPHYLDEPGSFSSLFVDRTDFKDYLWLYMTVNRFDYLVVHLGELTDFWGPPPERLGRVKRLLSECRVYEDPRSAVFALSRLRPPTRPVAINLGVWGELNDSDGLLNRIVPRAARVAVYNPGPGQPVRLTFDASTARLPLSVRLRSGRTDLATWSVLPGAPQTLVSPPIPLRAGLNELTIESDRQGVVRRDEPPARKGRDEPYRLQVARLNVRLDGPETEALPIAGGAPRGVPGDEDTRRR
jgi:hypothetical protein